MSDQNTNQQQARTVTSVDHGTAFGKAGEGRANEESLVDAMDMAILMAKNRKNVTK